MDDFLQRLKQRKLVQWAIAYVAGAFALIQVLDVVAGSYHWPDHMMHVVFGLLVVGFVVMLVLAWYHGERGAQRVSGPELLLIALALAIGGGLLWHFARTPASRTAVVSVHGSDVTQRSSAAASVAYAGTLAAPSSASLANATSPSAAQPIPAKSIAVLPFENLSTDKGNAYFADGMQDLILTKLADIGDLKVISRTSTEKYKSHPDDLKTIGQQLGVATILEGSVQKAGNQVLINVQLIDARNDAHVWAESYTRTLDNIFGVEGEVATKVADALSAKLTQAETTRVNSIPTENQTAYNAFLQGEYYLHRALASELPSNYEQAQAYYQQAVAADPNFALAWAQLAYAFSAQVQLTYTNKAPALAALAKSALQRALSLSSDAPEVRLAEGWFHEWIMHDLDGAQTSFRAVMKVQPGNAQAVFGMGVNQRHLGHYRAAVAYMQKAVELAPRDVVTLTELAVTYQTIRDYPAAQQAAQRAVSLDPDSISALDELVISYAMTGELERARAALDAAPPVLQDNPDMDYMRSIGAVLGREYATARQYASMMRATGRYSTAIIEMQSGDVEWYAGNRDLARQHYLRAETIFEEGLTKRPNHSLGHANLGWILVRLGKDKEALAQVEQAVKLDSARKDLENVDGDHLNMARIQAQMGGDGEAVAILDELLARPSGALISVQLLKVDPVWDPIRHDAAFQALLKKYGKAEVPAAASAGTAAASASYAEP